MLNVHSNGPKAGVYIYTPALGLLKCHASIQMGLKQEYI